VGSVRRASCNNGSPKLLGESLHVTFFPKVVELVLVGVCRVFGFLGQSAIGIVIGVGAFAPQGEASPDRAQQVFEHVPRWTTRIQRGQAQIQAGLAHPDLLQPLDLLHDARQVRQVAQLSFTDRVRLDQKPAVCLPLPRALRPAGQGVTELRSRMNIGVPHRLRQIVQRHHQVVDSLDLHPVGTTVTTATRRVPPVGQETLMTPADGSKPPPVGPRSSAPGDPQRSRHVDQLELPARPTNAAVARSGVSPRSANASRRSSNWTCAAS
jgi:hypothetical protein